MKETPEESKNSFIQWLQTFSIYDIALFLAILSLFVVARMQYNTVSLDSGNTIELQGQLDALKKSNMYQNIGHSYRLTLLNASKEYIIKADYANCLDLELFNTSIKKGDLISFTTEQINKDLVLSIRKGDTIYMDILCVQAKTDHISIYIPLVIALSMIMLWWLRRKIKQDRAI